MHPATPPHALYFSSSLRRIEAAHAGEPLMARAGHALARWATELALPRPAPILILAGPGNNGGDAFVAARLLRQQGVDLHLVFTGDPDALPGDAQAAYQAYLAASGRVDREIPSDLRPSLILDGLFGIGLNRAPDAHHARWIDLAGKLRKLTGCPILAVDCPSGLNADTGHPPGKCLAATHTLTFLAHKPGHWTGDGPDLCGEIRLDTLGIEAGADHPPDAWIIAPAMFADRLAPRRRNSHKGSYGSVGILGGSRSMGGAAILAARAALKLGAGRVHVGLLDADALPFDPVQPELMIRRADRLFQADLQSLVCGPGLGQSGEAAQCLEQALKSPLPLVLDADALNLLASDGRLEGNLYNRLAPTILTPHPGEAARLLGCAIRDVQQDRPEAARQLARRYASLVILKGCGSLVATPEGGLWINPTGNPGMASAGMGDVLSGLIGTLLAQPGTALEAALAATHLHGQAADRLAETRGAVGLTASEVIDAARDVFNAWIRDTDRAG